MKNKGISLVELLVAMVITGIILAAAVSMFVGSNRVFSGNRDVAEISEDVRNAITTLEFVFSRWGAGVPCPGNPQTGVNNNCQIVNTQIPPCNDQYPPTDPMCMDIVDIDQNRSSVTFYANLYGMGFVTNVQNNIATAISCRLSTAQNQNCYYIWNGGRLKTGYDSNGQPIVVSLPGNLNQTDCIDIDNRVNIIVSNFSPEPGDYITRVPHRIRIYVENMENNRWLVMERRDMAEECGDTEPPVRIGRVENFRVTTSGRSVSVEATFLSADGRRYQIVRFYGR